MNRRRSAAVVVVAALAGAAFAPAAQADDIACTFADHRALAAVTPTGTLATSIGIRPSDGVLLVTDSSGTEPCGAANRNNLDLVTIVSSVPASRGAIVNVGTTGWSPGFTPESGSSDEIEINLGLSGGTWYLGLGPGVAPLDLVLGGNLVNLNPSEVDGVDADMFVPGPATRVFIRGGPGADVIKAGGGFGTVGPFALPIVAATGPGADSIVGGRRNDDLSGGLDPDVIVGGKGKDDLKGEGGVDRLFGGAGGDKLLGGPLKDVLRGGKGNDRCTTKKDRHKGCEVGTSDRKK